MNSKEGAPYISLSGKVAMVTGGAQGIGLEIGRALAESGATVILADIQRQKADREARDLRESGSPVFSLFADVADPGAAAAAVSRVFEEHGRLDILVNNAAIDAPPGAAWEEPDDHWQRTLAVNLSGAWWPTKAALGPMLAAKSGKILFISSVAAVKGSLEVSAAYSAAKAGLHGLTVALATQVEQYGVLVNAILAGPTGNTGNPTPSERVGDKSRYPLGLVGPSPIVDACLYLASPSGDWSSGAILNVSGGTWKG